MSYLLTKNHLISVGFTVKVHLISISVYERILMLSLLLFILNKRFVALYNFKTTSKQ